jgi:very-short-patch-repair endonuclease
MVFHAYRVVVEYDGDHHRVDRHTFDRDLGRIDDLTAHGWRVVRIAGRGFFRDPTDAVRRIRRALLAGGWVP